MITSNDRILITGGAGLVGSHIVDLFIRDREVPTPSEIIILDDFVRGSEHNLEWAVNHGPVRLVRGDIRDQKLVNDLMKGVSIVFHEAAIRITHCADDPRLAFDVLAGGTFNIVEAAARADVRKIIAASSASVYGLAAEFPTTERHHVYNNRTIYGAAKAFNEGLLRSFNEMFGLNYVALRYFNVYGPRMDIYGAYTEVLIRWMERIANGQPPVIFGDGMQTMDFVYIGDVARANILASQCRATDEVFNVASGVETSLNDLARTLLKVMNSDLPIEYGPERKVNPVPRRLADTTKAERLLGFNASVSLEDGLRLLVEWWQGERGHANLG